jgi:hypothetical protein
MRRSVRALVAVTLIGAALGVGGAAPGTAAETPLWLSHARNYPGGLSSTVRSYADDEAAASAGRYGASGERAGFTNPNGSDVKMNLRDSSPPLPQNETAVAHNELDPLNAVAASNDYVNGGLWMGTTFDGGRTWRTWYQVPRVHSSGDFCTGGDPTVVYSLRDKAFYVAQLCFFRAHPESELQVYRSKDRGKTWTPARLSALVASNISGSGRVDKTVFLDKELLAVDNHPASPYYGRLYMTYVKFHLVPPSGFSDYCPVMIGYSDDLDPNGDGDLRDSVWTNRNVVPDDPGGDGKGETANQFATPTIDDQGGVDIAYALEDCNTSIDRGLRFKRSTTGGDTWPTNPVKINKTGQFKDNPDEGDLLPPKEARVPISPSLVYNEVTDTLGYVYQNNVNRAVSKADITFQRSTDYGQTWSNITYVSATGSGAPAPNDQFFPWIDFDGSGHFHVVFFDNRNDPGNLWIDTFIAESSNNGGTWANSMISDVSWNPNDSFFTSGAFFGDYNGLAIAGNDVAYPVWTDGRDTPGSPLGQTDIFTDPYTP